MNEKQPKSREINPSILSGPMAFLRRLAIVTILSVAGMPTAQAAEPAKSPSLSQAAEQNDAFKAMFELIKMLGKDYQYAGKQLDGSVIQCAQGGTKLEAEEEAEKRIKSIAGEGFTVKFTEVQLSNGTWVVAGITVKKEEKVEVKKSVFDIMGDLIKELGPQYQYAGKQTDGNVIQCAQGKSKMEAQLAANKRALSLMPDSDTVIKSKRMEDGTWVVAVLAVPGQKRKGPRGIIPQVATIEIGSTAGGGTGEIKLEEKKKTVIPKQVQPEASDEQPAESAEITNVLKRKLVRIFNDCHTRTLKKHPNFSGKINLIIKIKKGKIDVILEGKQDKQALLDFEVELESRLQSVTFPEGDSQINIPLVLTPQS